MPYVPPWLNPPDFLGAMRAGSALAAQSREMAFREQQAQQQQMFREQSAAEALRRNDMLANLQFQRLAQQGRDSDAARILNERKFDLSTRAQTSREQSAADALSLRREQFQKSSQDKNYGTPIDEEIAPGIYRTYRPGSPGMHIYKRSATGDQRPIRPTDLLAAIKLFDKPPAGQTPQQSAQWDADRQFLTEQYKGMIQPNLPQVQPSMTTTVEPAPWWKGGQRFGTPTTNTVEMFVPGNGAPAPQQSAAKVWVFDEKTGTLKLQSPDETPVAR